MTLLFCSMTTFAQEKIEVFFDFDQYSLNDEAIKKLNTWIAERSNVEVVKIYGFCDWKGTNRYNDTLSLKRVNTVFEYLKQNKVVINKEYFLKGFGENFEQSKNQSDNRKVIVLFEEKQKTVPKADKNGKDKSKPLSESVKKAKAGQKIKLENINFYNNSAKWLPKSQKILYDLLCVMEENPTLKIEIQGHICCREDGDVNDISTARAKVIFNFLIRNKINRNRLSYKGYGTTSPIYPIPEKTSDEEESNRRVEILILEK